MDKVNMDLDEQFLTKFFGLTERMIPDDQQITLLMMKKQLDEIEQLLIEAKMMQQEISQKPVQTKPQSTGPIAASEDIPLEELESTEKKGNVLIIDDLGVITYQLSVLFRKMGYEAVASKEIYDAIEQFKKQSFDLVIMDLFIPTEREGFILLDELKKITDANNRNTKIGVMSASSKKEHKQICKTKGAEFYVEKVDDWQKEIAALISKL